MMSFLDLLRRLFRKPSPGASDLDPVDAVADLFLFDAPLLTPSA